jgi:ABC-type glucose/galactose transport system permease subunit
LDRDTLSSNFQTPSEAGISQPSQHETYEESVLSESLGFWDKADRIAVVIAGGAALGGAIAQIPGAIVGAGLAAAYGWYISFAKTKSVRNS